MKICVVSDVASKENLIAEINNKKQSYLGEIEVNFEVVSDIKIPAPCNLLLIIEDDSNDFLQVAKAAYLSGEFDCILICDRVSTSLEAVRCLKFAPLLITLDFKIGNDATIYEDVSNIYGSIQTRFPEAEIIGYTNFERPTEDEIGNQAKKLLKLFSQNKHSVLDKFSFPNPEALANIFRDKIRIVTYKKENLKISTTNQRLQKEIDYAYRTLPSSSGKEYIVGDSLPMRFLYKEMQQLKGITPHVLILGERGSGKELVARAIYEDSPLGPGGSHPYLTVNCAEFSDDNNTVISELFGHVKGAFTGATHERIGVFEAAHNGTVFLDEIGTLSKTVQEKLLRFLETGKFTKLGANYGRHETSIVRLICATNADISGLKKSGEFREDFYDRIAAFELKVPSLKERPEDVGVLAEYLISNDTIKKAIFGNSKIKFTISQEAKIYLSKQSFSGNVRGLKNVLIRAMAKSRNNGNNIEIAHISESFGNDESPTPNSGSDCREARAFLDSIHKIILTNYPSKHKVTQDDVRVHFMTITGQIGVSRNEFFKKYFSPNKECIEKMIADKNNPWQETITKCSFIRNAKARI